MAAGIVGPYDYVWEVDADGGPIMSGRDDAASITDVEGWREHVSSTLDFCCVPINRHTKPFAGPEIYWESLESKVTAMCSHSSVYCDPCVQPLITPAVNAEAEIHCPSPLMKDHLQSAGPITKVRGSKAHEKIGDEIMGRHRARMLLCLVNAGEAQP
jgi:hypothetical protein